MTSLFFLFFSIAQAIEEQYNYNTQKGENE